MGTLIVFASLKGGVGKSTHAAALTAGLLDRGYTVGAIETDPQGSFGAWADETAALHESLKSDFLDPRTAEFESANKNIVELCSGPDFVVLDTAGNANKMTMPALYSADIVLCPFALTEWDIEGLNRTKEAYQQVFETAGEETPDSFMGLYLGTVRFISNAERKTLEDLSKTAAIRKGLTHSPHISNWIEACRTPAQLDEGIIPVEGAKPMNNAAREKAKTAIYEYTTRILEVVNA